MSMQTTNILIIKTLYLWDRYLSNNKIAQIKKVHFEDCPLSSGLYLSSNEIGWIEDGSLDHVTSTGTL